MDTPLWLIVASDPDDPSFDPSFFLIKESDVTPEIKEGLRTCLPREKAVRKKFQPLSTEELPPNVSRVLLTEYTDTETGRAPRPC